jgi:transcriptional regulator with XRE-family HTH domain
LRRLRESQGISAHDAAQEIRGSESKISRIELGRNAVREIDIADLLTLYGITDKAEREQLLSLASRANQPGWWHRYHDVLPLWFQAYIGLEESAQSIRSYDAQFVPGLLQTEEYAAAVLALGDFSLDEAERLVVLRKERQRHFAAGGTRLWAIVDEVALRRPHRHQPAGQVRHFHTAGHARSAALEPARIGEIRGHPHVPSMQFAGLPLRNSGQAGPAAILPMNLTVSAGDSAAARSRSKTSAQARTSASLSR